MKEYGELPWPWIYLLQTLQGPFLLKWIYFQVYKAAWLCLVSFLITVTEPDLTFSKHSNFSAQFYQVKKTFTRPLTIAVTCTPGFLRVVFGGNGEMDPLVLARAPEHLEVFLLVSCSFYFFPDAHSSPWMLCLERKGFRLQNWLPVNSSIPEHFGNRCNDFNILIKVK